MRDDQSEMPLSFGYGIVGLISHLPFFAPWLNFGNLSHLASDMPDDQSERIIKLLEEIRDLSRQRNSKFDEYIQIARERNSKYQEALQRQEKAQEHALRQRRLFRWIMGPITLLAAGCIFYFAFWVIPRSEEKQNEEQLQEYHMIQTNLLAQPH